MNLENPRPQRPESAKPPKPEPLTSEEIHTLQVTLEPFGITAELIDEHFPQPGEEDYELALADALGITIEQYKKRKSHLENLRKKRARKYAKKLNDILPERERLNPKNEYARYIEWEKQKEEAARRDLLAIILEEYEELLKEKDVEVTQEIQESILRLARLRVDVAFETDSDLATANQTQWYNQISQEIKMGVDTLTGLRNKKFFDGKLASLEEMIGRDQREGEAKDMFVLFFDIDNFKSVNDMYGHSAGDEIIKQVARVFHQSVRDEDVSARLSGDEFAGIIRTNDLHTALRVAERIRLCVEKSITIGEKNITISVGVSQCSDKPDFTNNATTAADTALYAAKKNKIIDSATDVTLSYSPEYPQNKTGRNRTCVIIGNQVYLAEDLISTEESNQNQSQVA